MDHHYDAFISYNHNPRDIKVTRTLQRSLENYKLPKGTRTSTGKEKIERVFLDSGELEAAGDLSKVLQDALDNADDLIVICSPESKASIWVKREIEYFLKSHSMDRIHTVLTDGEPIDVLPEILLYSESEDEEGNIVRTPREPLSCDYRMPLRQATRRELPRLVAAIVGCRYDDLVQRQRQYKMKRQIAALAAAAVFLSAAIGYLVWSNHRIRENLNNTLREESLNLAIQSEQALSRGDRIGAVRYALSALPSEGNERPVVARAVKALSEAIYLYKVPAAEGWNAVRQYESAGEYVTELRSAVISDRAFLVELFSNNKVSIWDVDTGAGVMTDYTAGLEKIQDIAFTDDGRLVLLGPETIHVIDPSGEKELAAISAGEGCTIVTINYDELPIAGGMLWVTIRHYDSDSGEAVFELAGADLDRGEITEMHRVTKTPGCVRISPDGRYLAYEISGTDYDLEIGGYIEKPDQVYIADTRDGTGFDEAALERAYLTDMAFYDDERLIVSAFTSRPGDDDFALGQSNDYVGYGYRVMYSLGVERGISISAIDAGSGSAVWDHETTLFGAGTGSLVMREEGQTGWDILYALGDEVLALDKDGSETAHFNTSSNIRGFFCRDGLIRSINYNGDMSSYDTEKGELTLVYNRINGPVGIVEVCESGSIFINSRDTSGMSMAETVTEYRYTGSDAAWESYGYGDDTKVDGVAYTSTIATDAVPGGRFVEIRCDYDQSYDERNTQILVRDSASGEILLNKIIKDRHEGENYQVYSLDYSGISPSGDKVYFADCGYEDILILAVDLEDGSEQMVLADLDDPEDDWDSYSIVSSSYGSMMGVGEYHVGDDSISYLVEQSTYAEIEGESVREESLLLVSIDLETGEATKRFIREITEDESYMHIPCSLNGTCGRLLCFENVAQDEGLEEGSEEDPDEGLEEGSEEDDPANGAVGSTVMVCYDLSGSVIWTSESVPESIAGAKLTDDGSVVILEETQNGVKIHFYAAKDGSETAVSEIGGVSVTGRDSTAYYELSDDESMVTAGNDAYILDADTKEVRTVIAGAFIAYDPENRLFMLGDSKQERGRVPYRSLDEMIEEARAVLE